MKKTFSSAIAKFMLAGVALVGVFASCQQEDLNATFHDSVKPAEATINVSVRSRVSAAEVPCTITATAGQVSGNTVTIAANSGKEITATKVTITATPTQAGFNAGSTTVEVNNLRAGGKATYSALIFIDDVLDNQYAVYEISTTQTNKNYYLNDATHSHDGFLYRSNPSEFMLHGTIDFIELGGYALDEDSFEFEDGCTPDEKVLAKEKFNALNVDKTETPRFEEFWVSAWSYYTFVHSLDINCNKVGFFKKTAAGDILLASANFISYYNVYYSVEMPYNNHYEQGHGHYDASHDTTHGHYAHGHGSGNAGGGIIYAE